MTRINQLINEFGLQPHPEGGWYKQIYKSKELIATNALPERFGGKRSLGTAIYFLLEQGSFSAFHRIKSDECWHFYDGGPLLIYIIHHDGELKIVSLGKNFEKGESYQYVVPANCWFASRPAFESEYSFVGCTVSPGFEFEDMELANANELIKVYPQHTAIIKELCM